MQIKTLAEILAEADTDSASSAVSSKQRPTKENTKKSTERSKPSKTELFNRRKSKKQQREKSKAASSANECDSSFFSDDLSTPNSSTKSTKPTSKKRKKRFHPAATFTAEPSDTPAYTPPKSQSIQQILAEVKRDADVDHDSEVTISGVTTDAVVIANDSSADSYTESLTASEIDNLPSALKAYLRTPEQKQAELDAIKAESRLRWLAFYYLSRREYGKAELKQKLIDKEQDPASIDALLAEFEQKGYQSDYRTTLMLIRENIRKGRGRQRIKQEFYKKKVAMPSNIDELIDMANTESEEFREFVDDDEDSLVEGVDWLKLAVEARTKKYGDDIPTERKDKAKQLRFLQYRGFNTDICFQALRYTLDNLDERF